MIEQKLIGDIVRQNPDICKVFERHFGEDCLKRPGFKVQTIEMACILLGIDYKRLLGEIEENRIGR